VGFLFKDERTSFKMELLKQRILKDGRVKGAGILKVDSFLNHQLDVTLINEIGKEFYRIFKDENITRILTVEASGIAISCAAALYFNVPVVFAKKTESSNMDADTYESEVFSFTKNKAYKIRVSKRFLHPEDNVLILDDFLANGKAALGLKNIIDQSGAVLKGIGIVIEKGFQDGGRILRELGIRIESLAIIDSMDGNRIIFRA
jgi:xanthine phosphoribosyltransferase